ncbi:hypothetical protein B0H13DRAFT_2374861 [Mycena leptocephala]|nr:hypothetical protein B0H13DRAFT_2374861 [Mycena leptocephala]
MTLKPIPPTRYDGSPDAFAYHRFIREGSAYVRMGRVPAEQQIFMLSYHLEGKAADFYNHKVVKNEAEWSLQDFFWGLFNYCFPIDYRMRQRDRLNNCFQDKKSVVEHIAELEELYNMIGLVNDQEKVVTLWRSLNGNIQREMYRAKHDPEISTWKDVSDAAEHAEIIVGSVNTHGAQQQPLNEANEDKEVSDFDSDNSPGHGSGGRVADDPGESDESESAEEQNQQYDDGYPESYVEQWTPDQLSPEKRRELRAARLCFKCEELGHIARDCPTWGYENDEYYEDHLEDWSPKFLSPEKRSQLLGARLCFKCEGPVTLHETVLPWKRRTKITNLTMKTLIMRTMRETTRRAGEIVAPVVDLEGSLVDVDPMDPRLTLVELCFRSGG